MDVIFYFAISLLIATVFCYVIFLVKNNMIRADIQAETVKLETVGTKLQKDHEKEVIQYQTKINTFSNLLKNHSFASNAFAFLQMQTMPNIWFKQFSLDERNRTVQLSGEADDLDAFSRQVAAFEKNVYVEKMATVNSSLGGTARVSFNISLTLKESIFSYIFNQKYGLNKASVSTTTEETPSAEIQPITGQTENKPTTTTPGTQPSTTPASETVTTTVKSSEKLIMSFKFSLNPEVIGVLDQTKHTIALTVPYGTNIKNLTPVVSVSPKATVSPASGVSQTFTSPVSYRVTAEDGTVQNYVVTVTVAAPPVVTTEETSQPGTNVMLILTLVGTAIAIIAAISLFIWKTVKQKKQV